MGKLIEGRWDCKYCGKKGIRGLAKYCPGCGHPQDKDVKFYMPDKIEYLDEETAKNYGKGADWVCGYCNSYNRYDANYCINCGGSKEEMEGDYFSVEKSEHTPEHIPEHTPEDKIEDNAPDSNPSEPPAPKKKSKFGIFAAVLAAILVIIAGILLIPKNMDATLSDKSWSRNIAIEDCITVQESDWEVPDGGRVYDEKEEIHHYDQVLDHYETVEEERTRTVQDGYDTQTNYVDNGDGTFSEETVETPRYITETYYETVEKPVYKDVPVYATKYYYEIEKWQVTRDVTTEGKDDDPYWGEVNLTGQEREGNRRENYNLIFTAKKKEYITSVPLKTWQSLQIGDNTEITVQSGDIKKINGEEVE